MAAGSPAKAKAINDAKDMYQVIVKRAERAGVPVPNYDFISLIGKGSYGRVYKCRDRDTGKVVAVKILDMDDTDYNQEEILQKDETLRDFKKEVNTLRQLTEGNVKNINTLYEAFDFTTQLWIVSAYCAGGSLHTLLKPHKRGLDESYIIPAARELAVALKYVHDAGFIHRDVKCANVLVTEEGELQLCDFGIAGIVDHQVSNKRMTIIGTLHFMSPEFHTDEMTVKQGYGQEVDVWAYGASVYEMATGQPPYSDVAPQHLGTMAVPRLQGDTYSQDLRDFVAFCLVEKPEDRPSMDQVLDHPYLASTSRKYPTSNLSKLLSEFADWEFKGGQRQSLFAPHGAAAPRLSMFGGDDEAEDEWNFSTSDSFDEAVARRHSQLPIDIYDFASGDLQAPAGAGLPPMMTAEETEMTPVERFQKERENMQANRGGRGLERIFSPNTAPYELHTPVEDDPPLSDLPLRNMVTDRGANRETLIDLDSMDLDEPNFNFEFGDIPTIKANRGNRVSDDVDDEESYQFGGQDEDTKRATKEWKFPSLTLPPAEIKRATMDWTFSTAAPAEPEEPDAAMTLPPMNDGLGTVFRPQLKHTATEPIGNFNDFLHPILPLNATITSSGSQFRDSTTSVIDLDLGLLDPAEIVRPSTANSAKYSAMSDASMTPFDLEDDEDQVERDKDRFSYHKQVRSEPGRMLERDYITRLSHARGTSLSSTDSDRLSQADQNENLYRYDYNQKLATQTRAQMLSGLQTDDLKGGNWDKYGIESELEPGFNPNYEGVAAPRLEDPDFPLSRDLRSNGLSSRSVSRLRDASSARSRRPGRREIDFPSPVPPHPQALLEDADPELVMSEMDRILGDLAHALRVTAKCINMSPSGANSADEDLSARSGDESSFVTSADEEYP